MRMTVRTAGSIAAGIAGLLALAFLVVESGPFKSLLKDELVRRVSGAVPATISVRRLGGTLFTSLELDGIDVSYGGETILSVERVRVRYRIAALLRKKLSVPVLEIVRPRVGLVRAEDGEWNISKILPPRSQSKAAPGAGSWSIVAESIDISTGSVTIASAAKAERVTAVLDDLQLHMSLAVRPEKNGAVIRAVLDTLSVRSTFPETGRLSAQGGFVYGPGLIEVRGFRFETPRSSGAVDGTLSLGKIPEIGLSVDLARLSLDEIRRWVPALPVRGEVSLQASARGRWDDMVIEPRISRGTATVSGTVRGDLVHRTFEGTVEMRGVDPAAWVSGPAGDINARVEGRVALKGALPDIDADVGIAGSRLAGWSVVSASVPVTVHGGRVSVTAAVIETTAGKARLTASGQAAGFVRQIDAVNMTGDLRLESVNLAPYLGSRWNSRINAAAIVRVRKEPGGTLQDLLIDTDVTVASSVVTGIDIRTVGMRVRKSRDFLNVSQFSLESTAASVQLDGQISLSGGRTGEITFAAAFPDLAAFSGFAAGHETAGSAELSGSVSGSLQTLAGDVSLKGRDIRFDEVSFGSLSVSGRTSDLSSLASLSVTGAASSVKFGDTALERIDAGAAEQGDGIMRVTTAVRLDALREFSIAGDIAGLRKPRGSASIDTVLVRSGTISWRNDGLMAFSWDRTRIVADSFALASGRQRITATGYIDYRGMSDFALMIGSVSIGEIAGMLDAPIPVAGKVSAHLTVTGDYRTPSVRASAVVGDAVCAGVRLGSATITALSEGSDIRFEGNAVDRGVRLLSASGTIPLALSFSGPVLISSGKNYILRASADELDLKVLKALGPGIEQAGGRLSFSGEISAARGHPRINGSARIRNGSLRLAALGQDYQQIQGTVTVRESIAYTDGITVRSGKGSAAIRGEMPLFPQPGLRSTTAVRCRQFTLMDSEIFSGTIDADLTVRNLSLSGGAVTGSVTLLESRFNIPEPAPVQVKDVQVIESARAKAGAGRTGPSGPTFFDGLTLDTDVQVPENSWIRGKGADVEVRGKLKIRKREEESVTIGGSVDVVRGKYTFRGRILNIDEGTITFTGAEKINPYIDARASTRIRTVVITVAIGGTAEKPEIHLSSEPPLDESDIIAYLLFGKPTSRLTENEGSVLQQTTTEVLGEVATRGIQDVLGAELSPDVINIRPEGGTGLSVGKYLSSRLFVTYEWRVGLDEITQTIIQYQLNESFSLRSQIGNEQTSGIDLFWTHDY